MLALYRKYRPKKLADILGQEEIVEILSNAAKQNKLAHAYLFFGPRGSGKTTMARLVAKIANCEKRQNDKDLTRVGEPCNECLACKAIDDNKFFDVIEEAHQLTKEAFNALLKTLEEPPEHVIFILATTEYEKMPATIVSRVQRFHFKRLPLVKIVEKLKSIVKAEKIEADDAALELIASASEGSLRDAESLLDQIANAE